MTIKELRLEKGITQVQCADYLRIPLRTYKRYEANDDRVDPIKKQYIFDKLNEYDRVDENHGKLTVEQIQNACRELFPEYSVNFCYLFGSYAKGKETESSDIDLLIDMPVDGMKYFELLEKLRERLRKRIDLLDFAQLTNNPDLLREILKDGLRIYG